MSVVKYVFIFTMSSNVAPAFARSVLMFSKTCRVCVRRSPRPTTSPFESTDIWPERKSRSPTLTACASGKSSSHSQPGSISVLPDISPPAWIRAPAAGPHPRSQPGGALLVHGPRGLVDHDPVIPPRTLHRDILAEPGAPRHLPGAAVSMTYSPCR